ncbi:MAG: TonB-dependent receptor [Flavobacteriaceae bacterium]|nr:TonB-dependent receptor [Flavobacteriaceae bacterium]
MRQLIVIILLSFFGLQVQAQETGTIVGKITDKEMNNEPLAFANVVLKGTAKGVTTDFDGLYEIANLEPGTYTVVVSFVGYKTLEIPNVGVVAGKVTTINTALGQDAQALQEVVVTTTVSKESEVALLLAQKKAVTVKESIGAQELSKLGVSDVATATTKISGVASSETSGDVFVRGLGDRYLSTTLNGLPVPSDDVEKKNIDLGLFPTRIVQNVSISKTYAASGSADVSSGTIDVASRELKGSTELSIGVSEGINTNVAKSDVYNDFKVSANADQTSFGFYSESRSTRELVTQQSWNTQNHKNPIDYSFSITGGKKLFDNKLSILLSAAQSQSFDYQKGVFRQFRSNFIDDTITDATRYKKKVITSGLIDVGFRINENHKLKSTTFLLNKLDENVFEGGRNGESTIFEETQPSEGLFQFIRDQNTKQTKLLVSQLMGTHKLGEKNKLEWAAAYNFLNADEPNRIRNEVNFDPEGDSDAIGAGVQLGRNGGFQQRKSSQGIEDEEIAGYLRNTYTLVDEDERKMDLQVGANYRNKTRDFESEFVGVEEAFTNAILGNSIDDFDNVFQIENFQGLSPVLEINLLGSNAKGERQDIYSGELDSKSAYLNYNYGFGKWHINAGLRYQKDAISVNYDIGNLFPRTGESVQEYDNIYPSLNLKYALAENKNLRFGFSKTITLPEFKEISPFEYVSPTGQVTRGNTDLVASNNYNFDLKWEYFPTSGQLVSAAAFYKLIQDPINKVRDRGSAGVFSYFNSGEEATVFGVELETRLDVLNWFEKNEDRENALNLVFNATRMWHKQDLKVIKNENGVVERSFQYKNITETDLQGASDWIFNSTLSYTSSKESPFTASLTANYASDKIFALGVPTDQVNSDRFYDDAIVEKGFVVLDAILSKEFGSHWSVKFAAKNLLNPEIRMTQMIGSVDNQSGVFSEREETVMSYDLGMNFSLGLRYKF